MQALYDVGIITLDLLVGTFRLSHITEFRLHWLKNLLNFFDMDVSARLIYIIGIGQFKLTVFFSSQHFSRELFVHNV
jgi:hypothetical protein